MAKKFGKFLLLSAAVTTAAAAAYYFLQKKEASESVPAQEDEDLDDFSDDLDEDTDIIRNYVRLTPEHKTTESAASCDVKENAEDALYSESQTTAELPEETPEAVVEFFNEDSAESQGKENA